jgi:hypothetical protein
VRSGARRALRRSAPRSRLDDPEQAHARVVAEMRDYLDTDALQFLMELSIDPLSEKLGLR